MQLTVLALIAGLAQAKVQLRDHNVLATNSRSLTGKNMDDCVKFFSKAIPEEGRTKDKVVEYATDQCALKLSPTTADHTYVCKHFSEFLRDSFIDFVKDTPLTVEQACKHTEYHLHELRVQTVNVPNVAGDNSSAEEFFVHGDCPTAIESAMADKNPMPKSDVPSFWYTFCVSQDCAHYLPSRHRWCQVNHAPSPTHSNAICLLVEEYANENLPKVKSPKLDPKEMCALYAGFMSEVLRNAEAYEYVVHEGSKDNVPEPNDPSKALVHSQLLNNVAAHNLRDNAAKPVKPTHSGANLCGWSAVLVMVAALATRA